MRIFFFNRKTMGISDVEPSVALFTSATLLLGEDDKKTSEDTDEVYEQVNRVPDIVTFATLPFFDDQLGVVQDEEAKKDQSKVQVHLEKQVRSHEDVCQ